MSSPFRRPATAMRSSPGASTRPFSPMTASDADGVLVPPELCRTLARLAVVGLAELSRRDGGLRPMPGLNDVLRDLEHADIAGTGSTLAKVDPEPLTVKAAALEMGVSERRVRQLAESGAIIARRHGRAWLVDATAAQEYRRERRRATAHDDQ